VVGGQAQAPAARDEGDDRDSACAGTVVPLPTLRKQGLHVFSALEATLCGQPLLPSF
jgi:hypothetical protein